MAHTANGFILPADRSRYGTGSRCPSAAIVAVTLDLSMSPVLDRAAAFECWFERAFNKGALSAP